MDSLKCKKCGHENNRGAKFCVKCGAILIVIDEKETGDVIFSATVPGKLGESQSILTHVLDLDPYIDSG